MIKKHRIKIACIDISFCQLFLSTFFICSLLLYSTLCLYSLSEIIVRCHRQQRISLLCVKSKSWIQVNRLKMFIVTSQNGNVAFCTGEWEWYLGVTLNICLLAHDSFVIYLLFTHLCLYVLARPGQAMPCHAMP